MGIIIDKNQKDYLAWNNSPMTGRAFGHQIVVILIDQS